MATFATISRSLLHMVGAVGMALGIEYDRTGVLTFLVPGIIGIFILIGSWVRRSVVGLPARNWFWPVWVVIQVREHSLTL